MPSGSVNVPIRLLNDGSVPLYLQIKYQITYLISSGRLPERTRLPPVRALAASLSINPNTVAQAYRELQAEGLIVSHQGRGSFVRTFSPGGEQSARRLRRLSEILREARIRARTLGFADSDIVQHLASLAQQETLPYPLAFVATLDHVAAKYARRLEHHLGPDIRAAPYTLEALERGADGADLGDFHFVLTFARLVPALEELFGRRAHEHHVIGVATEVTPATIARLAELDPARRHLLLAEERFLHSSLNLIQDHSPLSLDAIATSTATRREDLEIEPDAIDVILFTFGRRALADELARRHPPLELVFDISRDSVVKLRGIFPPTAGRTPASGGDPPI